LPCEPEHVCFQGIAVISRSLCEMARWLVTHLRHDARLKIAAAQFGFSLARVILKNEQY
jgi:hypothetical protein